MPEEYNGYELFRRHACQCRRRRHFKYAPDGAELLAWHFKADNVQGQEQARKVYAAISSILNAHHTRKKRCHASSPSNLTRPP